MNSLLKLTALCFLSMSFFLYFFSWRSMTSSTRSMETYMSLLTCSERIILPFTGIVTSIFCRSFSTLSVTIISVSGVKYFSSFPSLSVTAAFKPSVTSMFFPLIVKRILSNPFSFGLQQRSLSRPLLCSNYTISQINCNNFRIN